jgi:hypothetical protein
MNVVESESFIQWLEGRGLDPRNYVRKGTFSDNFIVKDKDMYENFLAKNDGKKFIPGVEIETRRVRNLQIAVDFKKHKKFRVLKHFTDKWYLLGTDNEKLTTLSNHQMIKLLGEHFEEEYYTKIYTKEKAFCPISL